MSRPARPQLRVGAFFRGGGGTERVLGLRRLGRAAGWTWRWVADAKPEPGDPGCVPRRGLRPPRLLGDEVGHHPRGQPVFHTAWPTWRQSRGYRSDPDLVAFLRRPTMRGWHGSEIYSVWQWDWSRPTPSM